MPDYPEEKISFTGGGIASALAALYMWKKKKVRITIYEKNADISYTTASKIAPSLTPDEIIAVVPVGTLLIEKMGILFNKSGGILVEDVLGINNSLTTEEFKKQAQIYGNDKVGHQKRVDALKKLGKLSTELWQKIYDEADSELKQILLESNFRPCRESTQPENDGYRIDLIYNVATPFDKAESMVNSYRDLGYAKSKILTPDEVLLSDPFLFNFCQQHSTINIVTGKRTWNSNATAIYRPGGCLDTEIFLPKFYDYLKKVMGTYINEDGVEKDCFHIKFNRNVEGVIYHEHKRLIKGLVINGQPKISKHQYETSEFVFCPGEAVGTLRHLGFQEPSYAGIAGAGLKLHIAVCSEKLRKLNSRFSLKQYATLNHYMEIHQNDSVLSLQARFKEARNQLYIGVGGTKAFYGDQVPQLDHAFAIDRNVFQLNTINYIFPELISLALERDTKGQTLTFEDLQILEIKDIAKRTVGRRAVAYDGFPTLGKLYINNGVEVLNGSCVTHLGSGGVTFCPAAVVFRQSIRDKVPSPFVTEILSYADSRRTAKQSATVEEITEYLPQKARL